MASGPIESATKENKLELWQNLISEQKNSNLTIKEFCQKNKISSSSLYKWKKVIKDVKKVDFYNKKTFLPNPVSSFVEIPFKKQNHCPTDNVHIIFSNGLKVTIPLQIEPLSLIQILKGLAQ